MKIVKKKTLLFWIVLMIFAITTIHSNYYIPGFDKKSHDQFIPAHEILRIDLRKDNSFFFSDQLKRVNFNAYDVFQFKISFFDSHGNRLRTDFIFDSESNSNSVTFYTDYYNNVSEYATLEVENLMEQSHKIYLQYYTIAQVSLEAVLLTQVAILLSFYLMVWRTGNYGRLIDPEDDAFGIFRFVELGIQATLMITATSFNFLSLRDMDWTFLLFDFSIFVCWMGVLFGWTYDLLHFTYNERVKNKSKFLFILFGLLTMEYVGFHIMDGGGLGMIFGTIYTSLTFFILLPVMLIATKDAQEDKL